MNGTSGFQASCFTCTVPSHIDNNPQLDPNIFTMHGPLVFIVGLLLIGTSAGCSSLRLEGLEVTQAIQEISETNPPFGNTVPLIAKKKTVVRAYFDLPRSWFDIFSPESLNMTARLKGSHTNGAVGLLAPNSMPIVVSSSDNGNLLTKRHSLGKSLNFELPPEWTEEGRLTLSVEGIQDSLGTPIDCDTNCGINVVTDTFQLSARLRVRVVSLKYSLDGIQYAPNWTDLALIQYWLQRAYPIADGNLDISHQTVDMMDTEFFPASYICSNTNVQVQNLYNNAVFGPESLDPRTRFIGLVADNYRPNGRAFEGCANTTPTGGIDYSDPASVPTGPMIPPEWPIAGDLASGTSNWDQDGSYGDWYVGHELGHLLGLNHLRFPTTNPPDPPYDQYDNQTGQLSDNGSYVGFDTGGVAQWRFPMPNLASLPGRDAAVAFSPRVRGLFRPLSPMPGTEWHDVMTYCPKLWISAITYQRIRCQLHDEDGFVNIDPHCAAGVAEGPAIDSLRQSAKGYGPTSHATPVARTLFDRMLTSNGGRTPHEVKPKKPLPHVEEGDFLNVIARIDFDDAKRSRIRFINRFKKRLSTENVKDSSALLRLEGQDGITLQDVPVAVKQSTEAMRQDGLINAMIPIPRDFSLRKVTLLVKGASQDTHLKVDEHEIGAQKPQFTSSSSTHVLRLVTNRKKLSGQVPYHYTWSAEDPDKEDKLSFTVLISQDDGKTWRTLSAGISRHDLTITEAHVRDLNLILPATLLIKVIASDGFNQDEQDVELVLSP